MLREVALSLVRASAVARARGQTEDARRIDRALATLLTVDPTDDDSADSPDSSGTRLGIGPALQPMFPERKSA